MLRVSGWFCSAVDKVVSMTDAFKGVSAGQKIMVGGFGVCGSPHALLQELCKLGYDDLTIVTSHAGVPEYGLGPLLANGHVSKMITSYVGANKHCAEMYIKGDIDIEFVPQGTLAERIRCGGAGIPGFYTATAVGTIVESGRMAVRYAHDGDVVRYALPKETRVFDGKLHVLETAIHGDVALIKAWKGDHMGNLVFRGTARNFNEICAKSSKICIAEVEELVETGGIPPDEVHLPAVYVDRVHHPPPYESFIEYPTLSTADTKTGKGLEQMTQRTLEEMDSRERIARRAALELKDGTYVNLGVGLPMSVANYIPENINLELQSENGLLGLGPFPARREDMSADLINAGEQTVTFVKGSSIFSSEESFAMIRGGHLQMTMLGALEVGANGDLANWIIPGKQVAGMGGGMDLVASGMPTVVTMTHTTRSGQPRIVAQCQLPLSGSRCVDRIISELAVFDVDKHGANGLTLVEIAPGITPEYIAERTSAPFKTSSELKTMKYSGL